MTQPVKRAEVGGLAVELWPRSAYEVRGASARAIVGFAFEAQTGVDAIGDRKAGPFRRGANTLSWVPPGCPVFSRSDEGGEYLAVHGTPSALIDAPGASERALNGIVDAGAVAAAARLRRFLMSGAGDGGAAALDDLGAALLAGLEGAGPPSPWLTAARLAAVDRCIDAHMHETLSLARLAGELGLSVGFLVRAFRRDVGTTPHRYVMDRRIRRATALLAARHPPAAVAAECGFADQSHLTRRLGRANGITPRARHDAPGRQP